MRRLFASCFGLGRLPIAPGTWGSLPPMLIFVLLNLWGVSVIQMLLIMATLALVCSVVCVKFAPAAIAATGKKDPREVVADEFAGQAITFLFAAKTINNQICAATLIGFLLFRLFLFIFSSSNSGN